MKEEVRKAIEEVRVHLQADGGDVELVDVTEDGSSKSGFWEPARDVRCGR